MLRIGVIIGWKELREQKKKDKLNYKLLRIRKKRR